MICRSGGGYILEKQHDYIINVYPGADASFELYEDDGFTYDYKEGKCARTLIEMTDTDDEGFVLTVHERQGYFGGRPDNGHIHTHNSIPEIKGIQPVRDMEVWIHGDVSVTCDGRDVPTTMENGKTRFILKAQDQGSTFQCRWRSAL